jgi:hypothetical protein
VPDGAAEVAGFCGGSATEGTGADAMGGMRTG